MNKKQDEPQLITCEGDELEENKEEFVSLAKKWHRDNGQGFLVS
jgi:hypothetical protein